MLRNVTVAPFDQAHSEGWAPTDIGISFDWAWRVDLPNNNTITGACNGKKKQAIEKANDIARKSKHQQKLRRNFIVRAHKHNPHPFARTIKK